MNNRKIKIAPSIMCCDSLHLGKEISLLEQAGSDLYHIDIMDGNYVENFAMNGYQIHDIKKISKVPIDVHLMVNEPVRYIKHLKEMGADIVTVHLETCQHIDATLQEIKKYNISAGIALNPGTSQLLLEPILDYIDMVLVMSVNPGFAGQKFIDYSVKKVKETRQLFDNLGYENIEIQVDGNINSITAPQLYRAGANIFVAGTSGLFFGDMDYKKNIQKLRNSIMNTLCADEAT